MRATETPLPVADAASAQRSMCYARGVGATSQAAREGEERAPGRAPRPGAASRERALGARDPGWASRGHSFEAVLRSALPQKSCPRWLRPLPRETRATRVLAVGARLVRLVQAERAHLGCGASAPESPPERVSVFGAPGEAAPVSPCRMLTARPNGCVGL